MVEEKKPLIRIRQLSKSFGDVHALRSVSLEVPENAIFGFLGPNGAGKTTLMKILLGLVRPSSGGGEIFGLDIVEDSVAIRERIGFLPQHPRFIEHMSARENMLFSAEFYYSGPDHLIRNRCDDMLELVGLAEKADRPVGGFSGGEKQRLGIALAQINQPDLLVLDEPASALDPLGRQAVLEVMERLKETTTIFYSTHILDDVQRVSDTVAILNQGVLAASGPIEQIVQGGDGVVYSVLVKGSSERLGERLQKLPWVAHTYVRPQNHSNLWQISVSDEAAAEADLLRFILDDRKLTVTEFNRKKYELEEIFMHVVKGHNNGS